MHNFCGTALIGALAAATEGHGGLPKIPSPQDTGKCVVENLATDQDLLRKSSIAMQ